MLWHWMWCIICLNTLSTVATKQMHSVDYCQRPFDAFAQYRQPWNNNNNADYFIRSIRRGEPNKQTKNEFKTMGNCINVKYGQNLDTFIAFFVYDEDIESFILHRDPTVADIIENKSHSIKKIIMKMFTHSHPLCQHKHFSSTQKRYCSFHSNNKSNSSLDLRSVRNFLFCPYEERHTILLMMTTTETFIVYHD